MDGRYANYDAIEHNNDEGTWTVYVSQWLQSQTGSADPLDREDLHVHSGAKVSKDKVILVRTGGGWEPAEFVQIHMLKVKKCRGRTA